MLTTQIQNSESLGLAENDPAVVRIINEVSAIPSVA